MFECSVIVVLLFLWVIVIMIWRDNWSGVEFKFLVGVFYIGIWCY